MLSFLGKVFSHVVLEPASVVTWGPHDSFSLPTKNTRSVHYCKRQRLQKRRCLPTVTRQKPPTVEWLVGPKTAKEQEFSISSWRLSFSKWHRSPWKMLKPEQNNDGPQTHSVRSCFAPKYDLILYKTPCEWQMIGISLPGPSKNCSYMKGENPYQEQEN